ncbi:MAG: HAD-IIA family hydrolase [Acidimicrobiales bacterium]
MIWVVDLDGVMWLGDEPIEGSAEAVSRLQAAGAKVVFFTNNSSLTIASYVSKLAGMGVHVRASDVLSSAQAAAMLLEPGTTALACAGPGVAEALGERGVTVVGNGTCDAVVVGWHTDFDFDRLASATTAVLDGAMLVGTNDDATYPVRGRLLPGAGAILASVAYATRVRPVVAGKPNDASVQLLLERIGRPVVVVGDRLDTDGEFAARLNSRFALVLSGVAGRSGPFARRKLGQEGGDSRWANDVLSDTGDSSGRAANEVDATAEDLRGLVDCVLSGSLLADSL